jgi:hypothetical protein
MLSLLSLDTSKIFKNITTIYQKEAQVSSLTTRVRSTRLVPGGLAQEISLRSYSLVTRDSVGKFCAVSGSHTRPRIYPKTAEILVFRTMPRRAKYDKLFSLLLTIVKERIAMKKPLLVVAMLALVVLAAAPALTQTLPNENEMSPVQETEAAEDAEAAQPPPPSDPQAILSPPPPDQVAAPSTPPPNPECGWYENPERGWGWDYWCYHPTQNYWVPVLYGVT